MSGHREFAATPGPYLPPRDSVRALMLEVLAALGPGLGAMVWQFGPGVLIQCGLALGAAGLAESFALRLRGRPCLPALADGSAGLTAMLLALSLPPLAPWWLASLGAALAILLGKQVYGGLGQNPFNPAMVGYAMVLVSFPREIGAWPPPLDLSGATPDLAESLRLIFGAADIDTWTHATPLDAGKSGLLAHLTLDEVHAADSFAAIGGKGWQWINLGFLVGGLWLLRRGRISWQIPAGFLVALCLGGLFLLLWDPVSQPTPSFHLFTGATMLGAFFIATDPVSAATTPRGRLIYGAGIGSLVLLIRAYGTYADGVAFGVLLMNLAAPTIDRYTRPRIYGYRE